MYGAYLLQRAPTPALAPLAHTPLTQTTTPAAPPNSVEEERACKKREGEGVGWGLWTNKEGAGLKAQEPFVQRRFRVILFLGGYTQEAG